MKRYWMIVPAIGLSLAAIHAQPPAGERGERKGPPAAGERQPGQPGQDRQPGFPGGGAFGRRTDAGERRADPQVEAWVKVLVEKITDPHDEIRDSARAALVAVGRPALPTLQPLVSGNDGAKATAARKIVEAIEGQQRVAGMMLGQGGFGGFGGVMARGEGPSAAARGDSPRGEGDRPGLLRPAGDRPGTSRPDSDRAGPMRPAGDRPGTPRPEGERPRSDRPPGEGRGGPMMAILANLDLNDKQRKQCEEIQESPRTKMTELTEQARDGKIEREAMRDKRKEVHESMMKEMKEVLTAEQYTKFEEGMKNLPRPEGRPDSRPEGRPGNRPEGRPPQPE